MLKLLFSPWINLVMPSFFGIGMGPSSSEQQQFGAVGNVGSFATSTGEGDISAASDFWKGILSGDQTQLSRILGPEYSNISKRGGQELKTLSEFGTRSGGTAAQQQQVGDTERAQASNLEGSAVAGAASSLGSMGGGLLNTGLSAHEAAFSEAKTIQEQKAAKWNDIFKSVADIGSAFVPGGALFKGAKSLLSNFGSAPSSGAFGDASNFGGDVATM